MQGTLNSITVEELRQLQKNKENFTLLDVREPIETDICTLNGVLIPLGELEKKLGTLDLNATIIVHCRTDGRSKEAVSILKNAGCQSAFYLEGGILEWAKKIDDSMPTY